MYPKQITNKFLPISEIWSDATSECSSGAMTDKVGFIGGGMMASALIGGFVKANAVPVSAVSVAEPFKPMRDKHAAAGHFASDSNLAVAQRSDMLWLAVKPDVVPAVLAELGPAIAARKTLVVSIAAGVTVAAMEAALPAGARVVRVMPNLPALVSECAAGFCRGKHATKADADRVRALLQTVGRAEEVPEKCEWLRRPPCQRIASLATLPASGSASHPARATQPNECACCRTMFGLLDFTSRCLAPVLAG